MSAVPLNPSRTATVFRLVAAAIAVCVVAAYFRQSSTLAPDHSDEGLTLQYIDAMARGERTYYDFIDVYGLANWWMPVAFYQAFGERVWGVRLWMIVLKVASVILTFVLVRRLASSPAAAGSPASARGTLFAGLGAAWTAILLGARWPSLQTAYAFLGVVPLVLGAWIALLTAPSRWRAGWLAVAAALTALTLFTKLNTGAFLLAGGLVACFHWLPAGVSAGSPRPPRWYAVAASAALALGFVAFTVMVSGHYDRWFFAYLTVPLALALAYTQLCATRGACAADCARRARAATSYFAVTAGLSAVALFGYYGRFAGEYVGELVAILSHVRYTAAFPPVGVPGHYVGLHWWLQLPWVLTATFVVWAALGVRLGPRAFGASWPERRARSAALFVLFVTHAHVIYARADETHLYQALVLAPGPLFVLLADLDAFVSATRPRPVAAARGAIVAAAAAMASTLFVAPRREYFELTPGDWDSPKLEHLRFRSGDGRYLRPASPHIGDREWDAVENEAARYVKSRVAPREPILLLTANRILHVNSDTVSVAGRYHYPFYLASVGLLDRQGFDALVPRVILDDILANPPRIIVSAFGRAPLAEVVPELADLRERRYVKTRAFRHVLIYERRDF